ncbi:MAG: hypothetical protein KGY80_14280 [Candidatus Thorarchaeota archaeon]|nr:hypothetical protein [Candidatus Thorarchaeota archaeon]
MRRRAAFIPLLLTVILPFPLHRPVKAQSPEKIVFDYSHGQYNPDLAGTETNPKQD